jgi:hypothetical protein
MNEKIRVLFLAANPADTPQLRLSKEAREIAKQIQLASNRDSFQLIPELAVRPSDLQQALLTHRPHIVHFSGHGKANEELVLEDDAGKSKPVNKQALSKLFKILRDNIRIVVFNACYSKPQAEALIKLVDYTVGTNKAIGDEAAIVFAATFYGRLAFGLSVREAFELANNQIELDGIPESRTSELLIRKGVKASIPFVAQVLGSGAPSQGDESLAGSEKDTAQTDAIEKLKATIERLSAGSATEPDRLTIQRALVDGRVVLEQTEGVTDSAAGAEEFINTTVHRNLLYVELGAATYQRVQEQLFPPPPGIPPPMPGLIFLGRENALADVKTLLGIKSGTTSSKTNVAIVRGWPGVGKTTLVSVLGRDPEVARAFSEGVLWTSLDQKPELLSVMAAWGRALGTDEILRAPTLKDATEQLTSLLKNRRMLLIVDDVWEEAHAVPFLQASGSKCALLVTTRLTSVAEALANIPEAIYVLPVLTEDDALKLLGYLTPASVDEHPDECRELVRDLECLPLALHVAGRLLRTESKMGWGVTELIDEIRDGAAIIEASAPLDRTEGNTLPTVGALLQRSTDRLDEHARECFAFLGVFAPKPATFDSAAMKAVWEVKDPKLIIRSFVAHGLLEPTGGGRFQMHDLLVKHARSLLT